MYYGYARKSTEEQSQASFEVQLTYLRKNAEDLSLDFQGYSETGSGKNIKDRPMLLDILNRLKPGDVIGFYDGSRLGRNTQENLTVAERIHSIGARLHINGKFVDIENPSDELAFGVESLVSTFQRKNQLRKSKAGIETKKRNGEWIFTSRLYGWDVAYKNATPVVTINESEARVVRHIFDDYERGESTRHIAQWLNGNGFTKRDGHTWNPAGVRRIILKPIYAGLYMIDGPGAQTDYSSLKLQPENMVQSAYYQPIITEDQFWRVYNSHRKVTRTHSRQFEYRWSAYPLSSIIKCECGKSYIHTFHKTRTKINSNYRPTVKHKPECTSMPQTLRGEVWEPLFRNIVYLSFLWSNDILGQVLEQRQNLLSRQDELDEDVKRIDDQLNKLAAKKKRLLKAVEDGLEMEDVRSRIDELKNEESGLKKQKTLLKTALITEEDELDSMADAITDEALLDFAHGSAKEQREYYLSNLKATIHHYRLIVDFHYDMRIEAHLHPNNARSIQNTFELEVYRGGKHHYTFNYCDGRITAADEMMQVRIDALYRDIDMS